MNSFPTGLDIRPKPAGNRELPKPRGTGKLFTSSGGLGLALLRLEHVESVAKGDLELELQDDTSEQIWQVSPWRPDWWPQPPNSIE